MRFVSVWSWVRSPLGAHCVEANHATLDAQRWRPSGPRCPTPLAKYTCVGAWKSPTRSRDNFKHALLTTALACARTSSTHCRIKKRAVHMLSCKCQLSVQWVWYRVGARSKRIYIYSLWGSNPRPMAHKTIALTTELREHRKHPLRDSNPQSSD
jgi:hypothetical protein